MLKYQYIFKMGEDLKMNTNITEKQAVELLLKYNKDSFHLQHAITVQSVMKW